MASSELQPPFAVRQHSRFLDLPEEIRNRIYYLALEDKEFRPIKTIRKINLELKGSTARPYLGLTRTCRQLRDEFLRMYQAYFLFWVNLYNLERYTATFLSTVKVGQVRVRYNDNRARDTCQVRDLIVLSIKAPSVSVSFRGEADSSDNVSHILSNFRAYPAFCRYVTERADKVELTRFLKDSPGYFSDGIYDEELDVEVKSEFWEMWMTVPREKRNRAKLEK